MTKVLFVCTGNTCRSPLAESLLKNMNLPGVEVKSAGTFASNGSEASINTKMVLEEKGIPHHHKSSMLTEELVQWADHILTMTVGHKTTVIDLFPKTEVKVLTLKEFAGIDGEHDIADPYGGPVEVYRDTYEEIKEAIDTIVEKLKESS
jgi:protein-tyrosine-phosphatase